MTTYPIVQVERLRFSYNSRTVLSGIDLTVQNREFLGLVGANGSGKTTLLNLISGVLRPQQGSIRLAGASVSAMRPRDRARLVAMVPQTPTAPTGFTALELVMMGRNPHLGLLQWEGPRDLQACRRAMELTQTWVLAPRLLSTLSGGERQRVFIARALAQEARLLLLDEPTAHLDIGYQPLILDMIEEIRQRLDVTVVAAMHDLTLAGQYCQRVALLHQGGIYSQGTPQEVLRPNVVNAAFGASVAVSKHPVHGTPVVLPIGKGAREQGLKR